MKTNFLWLASIAAALLVGFSVGRTSDVWVSENSEGAHSEARSGSGMESSEVRGRRKRTSRVSGDGGMGALRASWWEAIELGAKMDLLSADSDPFGSDPFGGIENENFGKFCAWALTARLGDFPDIMKHGEVSHYGGSLGSKTKMLLRRWCELDPAAALKWVGDFHVSHENDYWEGVEDKLWILKTSMRHHPAWAGRMMNQLYQQARKKWEEDPRKPRTSDEDPFSDRSKGEFADHFEIGEFAVHLATMSASDQQKVVRELNFDLSKYDAGGYSFGLMLDESTSLDVLAARAMNPETGVIDEGVFGVAVAKNWKKAHRWLSSQKGNQSLDSIIFSNWPEDRQEEAESWFLSRATSQEDLGERMAEIVGSIGDSDEQVRWLRQMEQKGAPVSDAWRAAYDRMVQRDQFSTALAALANVTMNNEQREKSVIYVYKEASRGLELWGGGNRLKFYVPDKEHQEFYRKHPEYYEFIKQHNAKQMEEFQKLGIVRGEE